MCGEIVQNLIRKPQKKTAGFFEGLLSVTFVLAVCTRIAARSIKIYDRVFKSEVILDKGLHCLPSGQNYELERKQRN